MEFNVRQKKAINAEENNILCLAGAGAGKTAVLVSRIERLLNEGVPAKDIVAITFTNLAASTLKKRLGERAKEMYVGTIHGYANTIAVSNGLDTSKFIAEEQFDKIIMKAMTLPIKKYPKLKHLLVDEVQDISILERTFLERIPSENKFMIGDGRQMIYIFRNGDIDNVKYLSQLSDFTTYNLSENYRNAPNIISFAEDFIATIDYVGVSQKPIKTLNGLITETNFKDAVEELEYDGNWGDWFILCRTNAEIEEVIKQLKEKEIPFLSFSKKEMEGNVDKLEETMRMNKVKVMTIHGAKGLESKKVIVVGARCYNDEERRISYVAATRAENTLYWCPSVTSRRKKAPAKTFQKGFF